MVKMSRDSYKHCLKKKKDNCKHLLKKKAASILWRRKNHLLKTQAIFYSLYLRNGQSDSIKTVLLPLAGYQMCAVLFFKMDPSFIDSFKKKYNDHPTSRCWYGLCCGRATPPNLLYAVRGCQGNITQRSQQGHNEGIKNKNWMIKTCGRKQQMGRK